jgi:hypothetical protein
VTVFPNELPVRLKITAFDALGKSDYPRRRELSRCGLRTAVREALPLDLTDNRDGTYSTSFNPGTGVFLVHVRLDGTE